MRLQAGQKAPLFQMMSVFNEKINLTDFAGSQIMISFYRYAQCPFCNLRISKILKHSSQLQSKGLKIIAFFQSSQESILLYDGVQALPFPVIPDPERQIYKLYGVESSFWGVIQGFLHLGKVIDIFKKKLWPKKIEGDINLIPADFLINPDLTIHTAYYGTDIANHLPLSKVREFVGLI